jgi:Fe-Mn family superoxide dismutase
MKKRKFLKVSGAFVAGTGMVPLMYSCNSGAKKSDSPTESSNQNITLPDLPYDYNALEPIIDEKTMQLHHGKHHAGYTMKAQKAIEDANLSGMPLNDLIKSLDGSNEFLQNNLGGYINHKLFWTIMTPKQTVLQGELLSAIQTNFDGLDKMKEQFYKAAKTVFGSGWAWLCLDENNNLFITQTENQNNPLMNKVVQRPGTPIMGIDVWEHAYYLKYRNKRGDYINGFMEIINWDEVSRRFLDAVK